MSANPQQPIQETRTELEKQLQHYTTQIADIAGQLKAAVLREEDLRQQSDRLQEELSHLPLMQLGRRMRLRAEQDNIRKKVTANQQLQTSLRAKLESFRSEQARHEARLAALQVPVMPVPAAAEPKATPEIAPEAPVSAAPAGTPTTRPAPRKPVARRTPAEIPSGPPQQEEINRLLSRLEPLYPEHQVFSLDSLSAELRDRLGTLSTRAGQSPAAFLQAQGWQMIGPKQALALRQGKYCTPGEEPAVIRPRLESVLSRLTRHYPDKVIRRSIQHDHKSLAQDVSGLYLFLGYDSIGAMLSAYGFRYEVPAGGRPATDVPALIESLKAAYSQGEKPRSIARITAEHPEFAGALKTLQNQAPVRFGMSLKQYLAKEGILAARPGDK